MKRPILLVKTDGETKAKILERFANSKCAKPFSKAHVKICNLEQIATIFPDLLSKKDRSKSGWTKLVLATIDRGKGYIYVHATDQITLGKAQSAILNSSYGAACRSKYGRFAQLVTSQVQFFII